MRFYVIDAFKVASDIGMGGRINTVMQTCFFAVSWDDAAEAQAMEQIKQSIRKTYGKRQGGECEKNFQAVDATLEHLYQVNGRTRCRRGRNGRPTPCLALNGRAPC